MHCVRFDCICSCIWWSDQPNIIHVGMSSGRSRWRLVEGCVYRFNDHQEAMVIPCEVICIDKSIFLMVWHGRSLGQHVSSHVYSN